MAELRLRPYAIKTIDPLTGLVNPFRMCYKYPMKYHDRLSREASKRREKFRKMKESGMSYRRIGEQFGISGQRVQQILNPETSK